MIYIIYEWPGGVIEYRPLELVRELQWFAPIINVIRIIIQIVLIVAFVTLILSEAIKVLKEEIRT